jgi:peptidoglycan/xylan/chitin deacetylase (PgdA/CDA1 family)
MTRITAPGWILGSSIVLFFATWVFDPAETSGSLSTSDPPRLCRRDPRPAARPLEPDVGTLALTNAPRTVYGFSHPFWLAITFDDGPHPRFTEQLLDILARYSAPATFFVNGYWLDPARADATRTRRALVRIKRDGHTVGNHTYSHARLDRLPPEQQTWQILANDVLIAALLGERATLFRPPYGQMTAHARRVLHEHDYVETRWNAAAADEQTDDPGDIAAEVMRWVRHHHGGIVLLHDRHRPSVVATRMVLERLTRDNCKRLGRGDQTYEIVPLDYFLRSPAELRARAEQIDAAHRRHLARLERLCAR